LKNPLSKESENERLSVPVPAISMGDDVASVNETESDTDRMNVLDVRSENEPPLKE
jgi:hypothetical protein